MEREERTGAPSGTGSRPVDQAPADRGAARVDPSRIALETIAGVVRSWVEWDEAQRAREGLTTTPDTSLVCPPSWPSHGMLRNWIAALQAAADRLPLGGADGA